MPYEHQWLIEGQVIYSRLWGNQTIEELVVSNGEIIAFLERAEDRLIHILLDDSELVEVPASLLQTRKALTYATHANLGWAIVFGVKGRSVASVLKDNLLTMLAKLTRARYMRVNTLAEAIDQLKSLDKSLQWEKVNPDLKDIVAEC